MVSIYYVLRVLYTLISKSLYNGESMVSGVYASQFLAPGPLLLGPMDQSFLRWLGALRVLTTLRS